MPLRLLVLVATALAAVAAPAEAVTLIADATPELKASVVVKYRSSSTLSIQSATNAQGALRASRAAALGQRLGIALAPGAAIDERLEVVTATGMTSAELARRLSELADVEYAVPNGRKRIMSAPNDPLYATGGATGPAAGQWYLRPPAGSVTSSIDAETAWAVTTGSASIVVAVIDTGTRYDHPDLLPVASGGNLLPGYDMISDALSAGDGDGRDADANDPGDYVTTAQVNDAASPFYGCTEQDSSGRFVSQASSWHGTQTAGLIGATTNNGVGMASVGRNVRIVPVRALGKCGLGEDVDIVAGMLWAAGLPVAGAPANPYPARVVNMSLGGTGGCSALYQDVVDRLAAVGTVVVASAGNETGLAVGEPGNCRGVVAVAGLRHVGTKVGYSSLGPEVAVAAPAGNCVNTSAGSPCLYPILTTTNSGSTVPSAPSYSDSYDSSLGTSFSAPLVAGTAALMLSAQPSLAPDQVKSLLMSTARLFPTSAADAAAGEVIPQCHAPTSVEQVQCVCTQQTCGAGMLDAGAAVKAAALGPPTASFNAQGLWWNAPAASESGWGINLAHQADVIFATWYTYDTAGKALWLTMVAAKTANGVYSGTVNQTTGPAYTSDPFVSGQVQYRAVGSGTLTFVNADFATFAYTVNGVAQTKRITRQQFGAMPSCAWSAQASPAAATNVQDLWWNAPAESESGWGLSLVQQGTTIFAVWYTYDLDGSPLWLSGTLAPSGTRTWTGALNRTFGPPFYAVPFSPAAISYSAVGTATLSFGDGANGTFRYVVGATDRTKAITRQTFYPPASTVCR